MFTGFGRTCDILWFCFQKDNVNIYFHIQCFLRLIDGEKIIVTNNNIYETIDGSDAWDVFGNTVYDQKMTKISKELIGTKVSSFNSLSHMDFEINFESNYKIQFFSHQQEESFRIIINNTHYVFEKCTFIEEFGAR